MKSLRELILLEDFKMCAPDRIVQSLNEQKVESLSAAAVLADEYTLTHKSVVLPWARAHSTSQPEDGETPTSSAGKPEVRECFYCRKPGHIIANCLALMKRQSNLTQLHELPPKGLGFVKAKRCDQQKLAQPDPCFQPFIFEAQVSLTDKLENPLEIHHGTQGHGWVTDHYSCQCFTIFF